MRRVLIPVSASSSAITGPKFGRQRDCRAGPWARETRYTLYARTRVKGVTRLCGRAVKLFPLPKERRNANLNTATFDRQGALWFTGQNGVYGRLDPKSGKMSVFDAP